MKRRTFIAKGLGAGMAVTASHSILAGNSWDKTEEVTTEGVRVEEGKVISVDQKKGRVVVEGINMLTKHTKPSAANQNGGIIHQEGSIDISNVMYVHKGKATRVGIKMDGDKKVRYAKSTGEVID